MLASIRKLLVQVAASFRNIGTTFTANLTNQAVVMATQVFLAPALIGLWGVEGFATWIVLAAIPTYVGLSDFGFSISAKSDMTMKIARGDTAGAAETLSCTLTMAGVLLIAIGAVYALLAITIDWVRALSLAKISLVDARTVLLMGLVQIAAYQSFLFAATIVRASGRPALEGYLSAAGRASEVIALLAAASLGGTIVQSAMAWAAARVIFTISVWTFALRRTPALRPHIFPFNFQLAKQLIRPSAAYAMMPLAQSVLIQGTIVVISASVGPVAVATFNTARVVTRLGVQISNTVNNTFVPFYSHAFGSRQPIASLAHSHMALIAAALVGYWMILAVAGNPIVHLLSRGQIQVEPQLFFLLLLAASIEIVFSAIFSYEAARNTVGTLAVIYAALAAIAVLISYVASAAIGLSGVALVVALCNLAMLLACALRLKLKA